MFEAGDGSARPQNPSYWPEVAGAQKKTRNRKIGVWCPEIKPPKNWVFVFLGHRVFVGLFFLESEIFALGAKNLGVQKKKHFFS